MKYTKGYLIVDENGKYVIGYVKEEDKLHYIAYDSKDRCAVKLFKTEKSVTDYIGQLNRIAISVGEYHQFTYQIVH